MKRLFDITVAGSALLLLLPVLAVISLSIWCTMGAPILFRQQRPGRLGKLFWILKFRTMNDRRDERGELLQDTRRLTRLGRLLRSTSLDELPTLWNVVRGDMSLVGPRPLLMKYLNRYTPLQARRHEVLPGVTGLAQVKGRNSISWRAKFRYDIWYVDHQSFGLDLWILAKTIGQVLRRRGIDAAEDVTMPEFEGLAARRARVYLSPPDMTADSRTLLLEAFDSNWIAPLGPQVDAFEREFAELMGGGYAVALSSGTAALHLALVASGIGPGDEVATSTLTFAATANAICYVGARPVFIDSHPDSWNLDPDLLAEELEERVRGGRPIKAVLAVDIVGQCADYAAIRRLCDFYELPLIEDAAEALGATYQASPAGTLGDIGCFSFNGNKIITTSGGGMLITRSADVAEHVRHLASQAQQPLQPHYEHLEVGYNYRLSNLLAAVGRGQLRVLGERVRRRRAIFAQYLDALADLSGLTFMPEIEQGWSTRWLTCVLIDPQQFGATREDIRLALENENIESRPLWKPMHLQPAFASCRARGGAVAERLFRQGLCLPSGSSLRDEEIQRVVGVVRQLATSTGPSAAEEHEESGRGRLVQTKLSHPPLSDISANT